MQSSIPSPPDESFWDKRNTDSTANIRAKLLQPVSPTALGPSHSSSQPGPSADGIADQSPFGLVGNAPPEEASATSNQSQNAQVSHLLRSLGACRNS